MNTQPRRIDLREPNEKRQEEGQRTTRLQYEFNAALPGSEESVALIHSLFPDMGEKSFVQPPIYTNLASHIHIGKNVGIMPYFRCMAAGKVTIEDRVQIAMNVSVITNNHDPYDRDVLLIEDVTLREGAWIGSGAIILPGVTVGRYAIVGAGSVVTHDVSDYTVVAGNPAREIRKLDPDRFPKEA